MGEQGVRQLLGTTEQDSRRARSRSPTPPASRAGPAPSAPGRAVAGCVAAPAAAGEGPGASAAAAPRGAASAPYSVGAPVARLWPPGALRVDGVRDLSPFTVSTSPEDSPTAASSSGEESSWSDQVIVGYRACVGRLPGGAIARIFVESSAETPARVVYAGPPGGNPRASAERALAAAKAAARAERRAFLRWLRS